MHKNDKITVVWLDPNEVTSDFCCSMIDTFLAHSDRIEGRVVVRSGGGITRSRNAAIKTFLSSGTSEWALLVDADMTWHPSALAQMIEVADKNERPIVGGLCFAQMGDFIGSFQMIMPVIYLDSPVNEQAYRPMFEYPEDSVVKCDATGAAFLLVHRSVLLKMRELAGGHDWSWYAETPTEDGKGWLGEDVMFCRAAKAAGFPIHVHTGAKIGHVKGLNYTLDEPMFKSMFSAIQPVVAKVEAEVAGADA